MKSILNEADEGKEIADLEAQMKTLQETVDGYKAIEAKQVLQEAIAGELKAAGLDPANKTQVSEIFLEELTATADAARRKAKIDDRKALVGNLKAGSGASPSPSTGNPLQESADAAAIPPATAPLGQRIARFAK